MNNFQRKTINEWLDSVNARGDWCYDSQNNNQIHSIEILDYDEDDDYDRRHANFLRELEKFIY